MGEMRPRRPMPGCGETIVNSIPIILIVSVTEGISNRRGIGNEEENTARRR